MDAAPQGDSAGLGGYPDAEESEEARQPSERERRKAVAPSEMAGEKLFAQLFKRNSMTYVWRVHLRTPRHMSPRHPLLPAGFPEPTMFWHKAASVRVFVFGFETFKRTYPADCWTRWLRPADVETGTTAQALREAMLETPLARWTPVQREIFNYTVDQAVWRRAPLFRLNRRLRVRLLWHKARGVYRVRKYAKAWLANHLDRSEERSASATDTLSDSESGRVSPSLRLAQIW